MACPANTEYANSDIGPQLLAVKSGAWGEVQQLAGSAEAHKGPSEMFTGSSLVAIRCHGYRGGSAAS